MSRRIISVNLSGRQFLRWLGRVWVFPIAVPIWILYILPFWAFGLLEKREAERDVAVFSPVMKSGWWRSLWGGWNGHALPFCIIMRKECLRQTFWHEFRHTDQWLALGVLFPLVYLAGLIFCGYGNHPLENDANRYAERMIDKKE